MVACRASAVRSSVLSTRPTTCSVVVKSFRSTWRQVTVSDRFSFHLPNPTSRIVRLRRASPCLLSLRSSSVRELSFRKTWQRSKDLSGTTVRLPERRAKRTCLRATPTAVRFSPVRPCLSFIASVALRSFRASVRSYQFSTSSVKDPEVNADRNNPEPVHSGHLRTAEHHYQSRHGELLPTTRAMRASIRRGS